MSRADSSVNNGQPTSKTVKQAANFQSEKKVTALKHKNLPDSAEKRAPLDSMKVYSTKNQPSSSQNQRQNTSNLRQGSEDRIELTGSHKRQTLAQAIQESNTLNKNFY